MEENGLNIANGESHYSCQQTLRQFYQQRGIPRQLPSREKEREERHALASHYGLTEQEERANPLWELEQRFLQDKGHIKPDPTKIPFDI